MQQSPVRRSSTFRLLVPVLAAGVLTLAASGRAGAQHVVTRAEAIDVALSAGPRLAAARADTMLATGVLIGAHAMPNPALSTTYSRSVPQYHIIAEIPFDYLGLRSARIRAADASRHAARLRLAWETALVTFDVDTTYTRALAARARADISRRNARDADSLLRIAERRRDAGDASELDVQLAFVNSGQQANLATSDSLALLSVLLDLQALMGDESGVVSVVPADSLVPPPADTTAASDGVPIVIAAAEEALRSADFSATAEHRGVFAFPNLQAGIETRDPTGAETGILPTVGISLALPVFNRNRGPIMQADAARDRARAELQLARIETRTRIARSLRDRRAAFALLERDRLLLDAADRVATMSLQAYREGAAAITSVIEAQRQAREVLATYVDDMAAAWSASAAVRLFTLPSPSP